MRVRSLRGTASAMLVCGVALWFGSVLHAQSSTNEPPSSDPFELEEPWLEPMPVPFDPELEQQIEEVQEGLSAIHMQMVRRKNVLEETQEPAEKSHLYEELEALRKERKELQALLEDLIEEARTSERTAIDEALARARWLERQQEYWEKKEELLRDRQE